MPKTSALSVTLPSAMAAMVTALRTLPARDKAVDSWLHGEVASSYDEFSADPKTAIPAAKVMTRLRSAQRARKAKRGR